MFNTVDLMLTDKCNLTCSFCYIKNKRQVSAPEEVQRNLDTCNWIVNQYRADIETTPFNRRYIRISLYGGEPTMAWDSVKALADWTKTILDVKVNLNIITNMVLMDEEKIDYCIANNISISPSIDGDKATEDTHRVTATGATVSDQVFANARILNSKVTSRSCRSTVTPETVKYMASSVKYVTEELGFNMVNQILAGGINWTDVDIKLIEEQVILITDWWLAKMREGKHYSIYYLRNMLNGIWNPMRCRHLCFSGKNHIGIDTSGNIYPCHRFCNADTLPEYNMGNIHNGGFVNTALRTKLLAFDLAAYHKENCSNCIAVNSCRALCLHEMMLAGNGMFTPLSHYCKLWPIYYKEAMRAHAIMDAENNQLYYNTYKPKKCNQSTQKPKPNTLNITIPNITLPDDGCNAT